MGLNGPCRETSQLEGKPQMTTSELLLGMLIERQPVKTQVAVAEKGDIEQARNADVFTECLGPTRRETNIG